MIDAKTYSERRAALRKVAAEGPVLILGHAHAPRNYAANPYPFRQNSQILYFCGANVADLALWVGAKPEEDVLYGPPTDIDDVVWHGAHDGLEAIAARAGIGRVKDVAELAADLAKAKGRVHYTRPYRAEIVDRLARLLGRPHAGIAEGASRELGLAIADRRNKKSADEVAEIEDALTVSRDMHVAAMKATRPGLRESDIRAVIEKVALAADRPQAYNPIVTVRGEVLHNNTYANRLEPGRLLLNDSGAESPLGYASDITRTFPVSGKFDARQRAVYEVVHRAQAAAIAATGPGKRYRDVHLEASAEIAEGLKAMGLMRGKVEDAVAAGAHALFFPHGLGHMLGLDVHDMEDLGEDVVGYGEGESRSTQFGLCYLRCARPLEPGFIVTSEPGIYFIPALIDRWRGEGKHRDFIDYDKVEGFKDFGGIRTEDDVLILSSGNRILGPRIPKTVEEIENLMSC